MAVDFVSDLGLPFLAHRLRRLSELFVAGAGRWLGEVGVSAPPRSLSTLLLLKQESGLSVTHIAERLRFTHPLIITLLGDLEAQGLVTTRRDPEDGRRRLATLTKAGLLEAQRVEAAAEVIGRAFETLFAEVGADLLDLVSRTEAACEARPFDERLRLAGDQAAQDRSAASGSE
ncbi:MAG: MarR family transcriptional regulator [Pseudomonadota bacterium]|nr:MarR family transcriptional regulator [Pseudomonadota bacterium]